MAASRYKPVNAGLDDDDDNDDDNDQRTNSFRWDSSFQASRNATSRTRKVVSTIALISTLLIVFVLLNAYTTPSPSTHTHSAPETEQAATKAHHSPTKSILPPTTAPTLESAPETPQHIMDFALHPLDHISREPKTIHESWRITQGSRRPDGVLQQLYLINEQWPGPTIEARPGDTLKIEVENTLEDEVTIQWAGLSDAKAANISRLPAGKSTTLDFTTGEEEYGPFSYRLTDGTQQHHVVHGGLFVHKPAATPTYDEYLLLVSDWYHSPANAGNISNPPDSILLNGAGTFDCSRSQTSADCSQKEAQDLPALKMLRQRKNLLHIINVAKTTSFSLSIPDSQLTIKSLNGNSNNNITAQPAQAVGMLKPRPLSDRLSLLVEPTSYGSGDSSLEIALDARGSIGNATDIHRFPIKWIGLPQGPPNMPSELKDFLDLDDLR